MNTLAPFNWHPLFIKISCLIILSQLLHTQQYINHWSWKSVYYIFHWRFSNNNNTSISIQQYNNNTFWKSWRLYWLAGQNLKTATSRYFETGIMKRKTSKLIVGSTPFPINAYHSIYINNLGNYPIYSILHFVK